MSGDKAVIQLAELATNFPMPPQGRYVREPARMDASGVVSLPPKPADGLPGIAVALGMAAAAGTMFAVAAHRRRRCLRKILQHQRCDIVGQLRAFAEVLCCLHQFVVELHTTEGRVGFERFAELLAIEEFTVRAFRFR